MSVVVTGKKSAKGDEWMKKSAKTSKSTKTEKGDKETK